MTTVGYGDTTPVSNAARSLDVLEAVMGQLYLAVTVARLAGAYISQMQPKQGE
ncbi:ion channel [Desulfosarcina sp.]|uniref:ion channel n=1 Tax=Desulfosarcina sp. TaxID=2027861 RepID=UPI003970B2A1